MLCHQRVTRISLDSNHMAPMKRSSGKLRVNCSESLDTATSKARSLTPNKLITISDLPEWHYRCEFKHKGYRSPNSTVSNYLFSLFTLHNETVDIWTHLIGATCHFFAIFLLFTGSYPFETMHLGSVSITDACIMITSLIGNSFIMFTCSWLAHLSYPYSERWHGIIWRMDQFGVVSSLCGASLGWGYYALMCSPMLQKLYVIFTLLLVVGTLGIMVIKYPAVTNNNGHPKGGKAYIPLVVVGILGWGSAFALPWITNVPDTLNKGIRIIEKSGCCVFVGFVFYVSKVPERWFPGYFDYVFSSHNIWHVALIVACTVYATGLITLYQATQDAQAECLV